MTKLGKRLFALLLCVMLCCSLMPVYARQEDPSGITEGLAAIPFPGKLRSGDSANSSGGSLGLTVTVAGSDSDIRQITCGYNKTVKLKVKATVSSGELKYQWYKIPMANVDWETGEYTYSSKEAISGATSASYTTPANKNDLQSSEPYSIYVCVVTDKKGATASAMFIVAGFYDLFNETAPQNLPTGVGLTALALSLGSGYAYYDFTGSTGSQMKTTSDIAWTLPAKYQFYRKESGGKWGSLKTVAGSDAELPEFGDSLLIQDEYFTEYTDKTAKMGTTYAYKYRAYINGAWTPFTAAKTITFNPFTDVSLDEERAPYIAWAYNNSVVKGDGAGHFNPDDPCTRMNFVMILWKMHGKPSASGSNPFTDVEGSTSENAVKWAVKKKLVTGTSATTFSPDSNLSRINIIMILYKLAGSPKASAESQYEDISGSKTSKAVNWAVGKGIISPVDETHFAPDANCSRALLVEILCKYNEIYKIL